MEVAEFQEKLKGICELAQQNGKKLTQQQIREYFSGMELETEQLVKVLQYLKIQGIEIEGAAEATKQEAETGVDENIQDENSQEEKKGTREPLTEEEKEYLRDYLEGLSCDASEKRPAEELFQALGEGDALAGAALTQLYLPVAAQMAADMNCKEIHLADLIQEANVVLLTALEEPEPTVKDDTWMRLTLRKGIIAAIEEQLRQKFRDDCLVAKVEKLEAAVKDLTDEDGENRFTVDELAVILDMKVDEIRDILRLTGDDK